MASLHSIPSRRLAALWLAVSACLASPTAALCAAKARGAGPVQIGKASYYSQRDVGKRTASGAPLTNSGLTAASKTLPLGTKAKVTNLDTGRTVPVTITDRGPYAHGRILDLSPRAAKVLKMKKDGVAPVKVRAVRLAANTRRR
jgi:rare lipoprotein A